MQVTQSKGPCSPAVCGGIALLAVLGTVAPAAAQHPRITIPQVKIQVPMPNIPPPQFRFDPNWKPPQIPNVQNIQPYTGNAPYVDAGKMTKSFEDMTNLWVIFILVAVGVAVVAIGVHLYVNWGRPKDPTKLALSDPWVRAQMNQDESYS